MTDADEEVLRILDDSVDVIQPEDMHTGYGGTAFPCPVCRRRVEDDADDAPNHIPRVYLEGTKSCYQCGTEYESALLVAGVDDDE